MAVRDRLASVPAPSTDECAIDVHAVLAQLRPDDRDALTLLAWDGLTPREAATVLGCTRAAFYLRVHRARRRVASELGSSSNEESP